MKQEFINFLKEHNAYERFLTNLINHGVYDSLDDLCESMPASSWVIAPFDINNTPEDFLYWEQLDTLWCSYY